MRTCEEMAKVLAAALDDEVLVELQEMLDSSDLGLWEAVSAIVRARHPELFDSPLDPPSGDSK